MEGTAGMAKADCASWLNLKISPHDKEVLGKMSVERDMSMSAICRQLIRGEVERYEQNRKTDCKS